MKQIIHSFLCGGTVWAACAVSQGVKAGGTSVSAAEDGEVVRPNIVCVVCEDISPVSYTHLTLPTKLEV